MRPENSLSYLILLGPIERAITPNLYINNGQIFPSGRQKLIKTRTNDCFSKYRAYNRERDSSYKILCNQIFFLVNFLNPVLNAPLSVVTQTYFHRDCGIHIERALSKNLVINWTWWVDAKLVHFRKGPKRFLFTKQFFLFSWC